MRIFYSSLALIFMLLARAFCLAETVTVTAGNSIVDPGPWVHGFGGIGSDLGRAVAVDLLGNIYLAGASTSTTSFGGSELMNAGNNDIVLAKYSSAGVHQWSRRYGGSGGEMVNSMALDSNGNIFIGGSFGGLANFGGTDKSTAGNNDAFLAAYTADGTPRWSRGFGNTGVDVIYGVAADSQGNVVITGTFQGDVNLGGSTLSSVSGATDLFIAKYSSTGTHLWSKSFPNDSTDVSKAVAVDKNDNIFITGYFMASIDFGAGNLVSSDPIFGGNEVFIAKFAPSGSLHWAKRYGSDKSERAYTVAVDGSGDVVVAGDFYPYTNLGGTKLSVGTSTSSDLFLAKYSGVDGSHRWSQLIGGNLVEAANSLATDIQGNIFLTGSFNSACSFGSFSLPNAGYEDIFLAKYSTLGSLIWVEGFGGAKSDISYSIAVDASGYSVTTGAFAETSSLGGSTLTSQGFSDAFLMRHKP